MSESQKKDIITQWVMWHFYEVPKFLFSTWENFLTFALYYFSIPLLLATLVSPWKKYNWSYPKFFDIGGYVSTFISNIFSRVIGAICRLALILFGILSVIGVILLGGLIILTWFLLPLIFLLLILLLFYGF